MLAKTMMDARDMRNRDTAAWFDLMEESARLLATIKLKALGYHNVAQDRLFNLQVAKSSCNLRLE